MRCSFFKKIGGIACVCVLMIALVTPAFSAEFTNLPGAVTPLKMIDPGQKAKDFTVKTLKNEDFKLSDMIGKKVIFLLFWSIFCQPCQEEIPVIKEMSDKMGKDKVVILAVSLDGDKRAPAIVKFIDKNKLDFTFLMDVFSEDSSGFIASDMYGVLGTPTYYIIDKEGVITSNHTGKSSIEDLLKRINDAKP